MATRNDVAKRANVSPAVVSYVLNNSNYVSEEKRTAVLRAVEELHYQPNYLAKSLKTQRTYNFALLSNDIRYPRFAEYLYYMEKYSFENGFQVTMCTARQDDAFLDMILERQFDAIYMLSNWYTSEQLNFLSQKVPVVLSKTRHYDKLSPNIHVVAADVCWNMRMITDYMIEKGHERIGFVPAYHFESLSIYNGGYRLKGYRMSLLEHDIPFREDYVCLTQENNDSIYAYLDKMISLGSQERPTAYVAGNDQIAAIVMNYLKQKNYRVPDDVSVGGVDNLALGTLTSPSLTTVDARSEIIAEKAFCTMQKMINKEPVEDCFIKGELIIRNSTL